MDSEEFRRREQTLRNPAPEPEEQDSSIIEEIGHNHRLKDGETTPTYIRLTDTELMERFRRRPFFMISHSGNNVAIIDLPLRG